MSHAAGLPRRYPLGTINRYFPVSIIKRAVRFLSGFYSIGIKGVKSEGPRSQLYGLYISWLHNLRARPPAFGLLYGPWWAEPQERPLGIG